MLKGVKIINYDFCLLGVDKCNNTPAGVQVYPVGSSRYGKYLGSVKVN